MSPAERAEFERDAYPVVKRIGRYKGKTYGIPIGVNTWAVYYLPEALHEAGYAKFPATWKGLMDASARMTKRNSSGEITRLGFLPGDFATTLPSFGGGLYDFKRNRLTLAKAQNLLYLQALAALSKRDGYDAVQRFQAGLNTASFAGGWPFIGGAYAAAVDGQWRVEQLAKYAPKLDYATAPLPYSGDGELGDCVAGGNFMLIPRPAKEKAGAWDFVKFWSGLTDPDQAAEFYVWGGWLPLSERVAQAPIYQAYIRKHPQFETFVDLMRNPDLLAQPPVAYQVFVNDTVTRLQDLAIRGDISPKDAINELVTDVDQEIKRRKELGYDE
jgi:multiple sugar transport system substrate-binding protein